MSCVLAGSTLPICGTVIELMCQGAAPGLQDSIDPQIHVVIPV